MLIHHDAADDPPVRQLERRTVVLCEWSLIRKKGIR